jgi:hypothetical protein
MSLASELYSLDTPKDDRPLNIITIEVLTDMWATIRAWRYTRRQVVILGVACGVVRLVLPLT